MLHNLLLFGPLGGTEIIALIFVILLLFGGKKIPELARGLGKGIREFNSAKSSIEDEIKEGIRKGDDKKLPSDK